MRRKHELAADDVSRPVWNARSVEPGTQCFIRDARADSFRERLPIDLARFVARAAQAEDRPGDRVDADARRRANRCFQHERPALIGDAAHEINSSGRVARG